MKLQFGKCYKTRNGNNIFMPIKENEHGTISAVPISGSYSEFNEFHFHKDGKGSLYEFMDLIEEVPHPHNFELCNELILHNEFRKVYCTNVVEYEYVAFGELHKMCGACVFHHKDYNIFLPEELKTLQEIKSK